MAVNKVIAKVVEKSNPAPSYWFLKLGFEEDFFFTPGQYVSLKVLPDGTRRSYSIASPPDGKAIGLLVDVTPMGMGSKFLLALNVGDEVEVLGPLGHFVLKEPVKKILFVATGSGIVPFWPMIYDLLEKRGFKDEIHLDWGMRHEEDLFWIDEFNDLQKRYPNFKFDVVLSKPTAEWYACSGHVGDCLIKHRPSWEGWEAYLCGNQKMIMEVGSLLQKMGVKLEDVHFEKFF